MKTLSRCRNNINADNVVLIDVDTYDFNNVIVLDIPESHKKKRGSSSHKTRPLRTYIYIDDDDGDESPCDQNPKADLKKKRNFENVASSSRRYGSENPSPVKLSKGKRTYSGRGFNARSDSDASDANSPDCECMEDFSGKLREDWERASLKRKGVVNNDHASSSMPHVDTHSDTRVNKNKQHDEGSNIKRSRHEEKAESPDDCGPMDVNGGKVDSPLGETPFTSEEENEKNDFEIDATVAAADDDVHVEDSIIDQREKLKETDEYKRALEEELLARQEALRIQAEEAQQLRRLQKRKKAEGLRLLDMERRQKQRVEEIRENQKKDEENMNLKEQYRTEYRQELKRLEFTCFDMASLLRGLGIQVGSSPFPLPHEVRAAYKRALLSFHPDRASGSDMRQQVQAEEKFKLISRMKERFSL